MSRSNHSVAMARGSLGSNGTRVRGTKNFNICYSSALTGDMSVLLGSPHYSYRFAEDKFVTAIEAQGYIPYNVKMPEYYGTKDSFPPGFLYQDEPTLHLIFRSTEEIRLLKFAWNICCFAWEFDVIKDDTKLGEHPFLNQKRMLELCNEVWVPCRYTRKVLDQHGLRNTHIIPAPIDAYHGEKMTVFDALSFIGDVFVAPLYHNFLQSKQKNKEICSEASTTLVEFVARRLRLNSKTKIYLTIFNPEDFRKNIDAMLRAFHFFSKDRDDAVLLVKVLTSNARFSLLDVVADVIPNKLESGTGICSENIVFFSEYLSGHGMDCLYSMADFYLCASVCEGQNLPLLEAMGHGVLPITTAGTAMMDYITDENAIIIADQLVPNDCIHFAGTIAGKPFNIRRARAKNIYDALIRSASISDKRYQRMVENAKQSVIDGFSIEFVWSRITERLRTIRPLALVKVPQ